MCLLFLKLKKKSVYDFLNKNLYKNCYYFSFVLALKPIDAQMLFWSIFLKIHLGLYRQTATAVYSRQRSIIQTGKSRLNWWRREGTYAYIRIYLLWLHCTHIHSLFQNGDSERVKRTLWEKSVWWQKSIIRWLQVASWRHNEWNHAIIWWELISSQWFPWQLFMIILVLNCSYKGCLPICAAIAIKKLKCWDNIL